MITTIKKTLQSSITKNFFMYSFSSLLLRGISIFTAPITMSVLTPPEYGLLALANSFISILTLFLGLGLRQAFSLEFFHLDTVDRKKMINDIITIYLICTSTIYVGLLCIHPLINTFVFAGHATRTIIHIALFICFIYFFVELFYQVLQYQTKAKNLVLIQTTIALSTICLQLTFLCILKLGVTSMLLAQAIGMCIAVTLAFNSYMKKNCPLYFNIKRSYQSLRSYVSAGLPFIPSVLFSWIIASGDRWVLAHMSSMHDVGIYSLADAFGQLFHVLVLYPMSCSYLPYMLNHFKKNNETIIAIERKNQTIMFYCMSSLFALITGGYLLCRPLLGYVLPAAYHEAIDYIWFILTGLIFLMGTYFLNCLIQFHKKRHFLGFSLLLPAAMNIALNILLIPHFRIYGCVCATMVSYISYFALTWWYNKKVLTTLEPTTLEHTP